MSSVDALAVDALVRNANRVRCLTANFCSFKTTDYDLIQLSEAIAISCASLETVAIEQLDVSALLPPTTSTIHQRPPLWLEQHTDDLIARSRKVNGCASSLTTSLTQSRAGSVDSSEAPRRVVAVHNRCDSLVAAHLRVETEEVPAPTAAVRVPSAQRLYSDLGEFRFGEAGGEPHDNEPHDASPWRYCHRRRSTNALIESGVSVDGGVQEIINALCFKCFVSAKVPPARGCPIAQLKELSLVNLGLEDQNLRDLCPYMLQLVRLDLRHNRLRGGFVAQLAASAEVTPNLCVRSMDLSYNQLCDEDLVPLTWVLRDGGVLAGCLKVLNVSFNRVSHAYRCDVLAAVSQGPHTAIIRSLLRAAFGIDLANQITAYTPHRQGTLIQM